MKKVVKKIDISDKLIGCYKSQIDFVYLLDEETRNLLKLLENCYFFNVDYYDGIVFINKFSNIYNFLSKGSRIHRYFRKLLREMECCYGEITGNIYDKMDEEVITRLEKIYEELLERGIYKSI